MTEITNEYYALNVDDTISKALKIFEKAVLEINSKYE